MALRSPSSTPRHDLAPCDSTQVDSPPPTSQGGSGNGAKADFARKTKEVEHVLASLEKEGVVIDGKMTSILDDEIAKIKAEAVRLSMSQKETRRCRLLQVVFALPCSLLHPVVLVSSWEWSGLQMLSVRIGPREDLL
ncbi:unnamed protein product [Urochloa decumbens]|uniref:Uncharacterized protein n=1 Tax=Urochloa decumbens TaxID=240449 RepID=A0ABC9GDV3_9POAL